MVAVLAVGLLVGCAPDPCEKLCDTMRQRFAVCLADWPVGWEELDATGPLNFQRQCRSQWSSVRADLEPRELQDALDQCSETNDDIDAMQQDGSLCDELRALYVGTRQD